MKRCLLYIATLVFFFVFIVLHFASSASDDITSSVNVPNAPPVFSGVIPNFSWALNENLTNAFNISAYFSDPNGDNLTYYTNYTDPFNVTVSFNYSSGYVSFYPDTGFSGLLNLTFIASDGLVNASSNRVFLRVGLDNESPQWYNASKSISAIEQNDVVSFWATWTDNIALSGWIFSIKQGSSWTNYSGGTFSGTTNLSNYSIQISAAPGSTVQWKIYAYDTSGNYNVTDTFDFSVAVPPSSGGSGSGSGGSGGGGSGSGGGGLVQTGVPDLIKSILDSVGVEFQLDYDLTVTPSSLDVEILQGESRSFVLNVRNTGTNSLDVAARLLNIDSFSSINTNRFSLTPDASKDVLLDMSIPRNYPPGQYIGILQLTATNVTRNVPILVTVKHFDPFIDFNVSVPPSSQLVRPGRNVTVHANLTQFDYVKDLNAQLYLSVKDRSGFIYDTLERNVTIGPSAQFIHELNIPQLTEEGKYLVYGRIEFEDKFAIDTDGFDVGYRFKLESFLRYGSVFFIIFLLSLVFIILILRYERSKKKERLLELYLLLSQLKDKLSSNDLSSASDIYIKIKHVYGEPVPQEVLADREFLKKELKRFSDAIKNSPIAQEVAEKEGGEGDKGDAKDGKEGEGEKPQEGEDSKKAQTQEDSKSNSAPPAQAPAATPPAKPAAPVASKAPPTTQTTPPAKPAPSSAKQTAPRASTPATPAPQKPAPSKAPAASSTPATSTTQKPASRPPAQPAPSSPKKTDGLLNKKNVDTPKEGDTA